MLDFILSLLWQFFAPTPPLSQTELGATTTAELVRVIDGDTIDVLIAGREERVRYIGIDTPEPRATTEPECFASEATALNRNLLSSTTLSLVADLEDRDRYGRLLRYVYVGDTHVNYELLRAGAARTLSISPNTTQAKAFAAAELIAREANGGMWAMCR